MVLDREFDHTVDSVIGVFQSGGFLVEPVESGDLPNDARPGEPHRYALLHATLPELSFHIDDAGRASMFGCRLSIYQLTVSRTLLTVDIRLLPYPSLSLLIPRVTSRMREALDRLIEPHRPAARRNPSTNSDTFQPFPRQISTTRPSRSTSAVASV
jgi:hypothetical protein